MTRQRTFRKKHVAKCAAALAWAAALGATVGMSRTMAFVFRMPAVAHLQRFMTPIAADPQLPLASSTTATVHDHLLRLKSRAALQRRHCAAEGSSDESGEDDGWVLPSVLPVTPIGPFCPYRSKACSLEGELGQNMGSLAMNSPNFAQEMAKISLDAQMGRQPEPGKVGKLADDLEESLDKWEVLLARLQLGDDFQSREYYKLTECHLKRQGKTLRDIGGMVRFQVQAMRAFVTGMPPPAPPPGLDMSAPPQNAVGSLSPPSITADPFTGKESAFQSKEVKDEYYQLCDDHAKLIELGERYGQFDPLGKCAYLDQISSIEKRWDVFFYRFSLMGELNQQFKEQSDEYLVALGLGAGEFRTLLSETHDAMREDAERERNLNGVQ